MLETSSQLHLTRVWKQELEFKAKPASVASEITHTLESSKYKNSKTDQKLLQQSSCNTEEIECQ